MVRWRVAGDRVAGSSRWFYFLVEGGVAGLGMVHKGSEWYVNATQKFRMAPGLPKVAPRAAQYNLKYILERPLYLKWAPVGLVIKSNMW